MADFRVEVFGGLRAFRDGIECQIPGQRAGVVLAVLLLARGDVVGPVELALAVWGEESPSTATNQLQRLVGQLRRAFEPDLPARATGSVVLAAGDGYRLSSAVGTDLRDLEHNLDSAQSLAHTSPREAMTAFIGVLALVRPEPFSGLERHLAALPSFVAIGRLRVRVVVEALELVPALDERVGSDLVDRCEPIASRFPFEERLVAGLVRSLGAVGRRADALARYAETRTVLRDELGVDPGPELRAAQAEVLALEGQPSSGIIDDAPAQLPPALPGMTVRPKAQAVLDEIAERGDAHAVLVTAIGGMGGIGKTTVAVAWAHQLAHRFPDGQLYLNLRGFDAEGRVMSPLEAVTMLLGALGVAAASFAEGLAGRSAQLRTALAGRRYLLLLDNARDAEQVRPLLPGGPGCLAVVTSRNRLSSLVLREGAVPVQLDRMDDDEARAVLTLRLGAHALTADPAATQAVLERCAGLPLALSLIATRLALEPQLSLADLAFDLKGNSLGAWSSDDQSDDLASIFRWSYDALPAEARTAFRRISVHPSAVMSGASLSSVIATSAGESRQLLQSLCEVNLLERITRDGYAMHDLLRSFAWSLLGDGEERRAAERRLVDHYAVTARHLWSAFGRSNPRLLDAPAAHVVAEELSSEADCITWYERERIALSDAVDVALARGWSRAAANLVLDSRPLTHSYESARDLFQVVDTALAAARALGDSSLTAELLRDQGSRAVRLRMADGEQMLDQAEALFRAEGDLVGVAATLRNRILSRWSDVDERLRLQVELVAMADAAGDDQLRATAWSDLSNSQLEQQNWQEAIDSSQRALEISRNQGWEAVTVTALLNQAEAFFELGRYADAMANVDNALEAQSPDWLSLCALYGNKARIALRLERLQTAREACSQFRTILLDHRGYDLETYSAAETIGRYEQMVAEVEAALGVE